MRKTLASTSLTSDRLAALSLDPAKISHLGVVRSLSATSISNNQVTAGGNQGSGRGVEAHGGAGNEDGAPSDDDSELERSINVFRTTITSDRSTSRTQPHPALHSDDSDHDTEYEDLRLDLDADARSSRSGRSGIQLITVTEPDPSPQLSATRPGLRTGAAPSFQGKGAIPPRLVGSIQGSQVIDVKITGWEMVGGRSSKIPGSGKVTSAQEKALGPDMAASRAGGAFPTGPNARGNSSDGTSPGLERTEISGSVSVNAGRMDEAQMGAYIVYKCEFILSHPSPSAARSSSNRTTTPSSGPLKASKEGIGHSKIHKLLRYTDFETFRRVLKRTFPDHHAAIMSLPSKNHLRKFDPTFLDNRQARLQYWLKTISLHPVFGGSPLVKAWLSGAKGG